MFKSRRRKAEEEAKLDPEYRPTKILKAEGEDELNEHRFPWAFVIILGVLVVLAAICIIVICCNKK